MSARPHHARFPVPFGGTALAMALRPQSERGARRVGLMIEGGGMRGAFAAGVAAGLADGGVAFDAFDGVFGSSAGGLNLMYWISRRPHEGTRVYAEDLPRSRNPAFFCFKNPLGLFGNLAMGRAILNLHAIEHAMTTLHPIDFDAVRAHPVPVLFCITALSDLKSHVLDARELDRADLLPTLLAGASMPVVADPYDLTHGQYVDGACGMPLPVPLALERGITDLVVIVNLPVHKEPAWYETWALSALGGRRGLPRRVGDAVMAGRHAREEAMAILATPPPGVTVTVIAPETRLISSLERDEALLEMTVTAGIAAGRRAVLAARAVLLDEARDDAHQGTAP